MEDQKTGNLLVIVNITYRFSHGLKAKLWLIILVNKKIKVTFPFLLAKLFSDLDNPDCLDFRANRNKNLK